MQGGGRWSGGKACASLMGGADGTCGERGREDRQHTHGQQGDALLCVAFFGLALPTLYFAHSRWPACPEARGSTKFQGPPPGGVAR